MSCLSGEITPEMVETAVRVMWSDKQREALNSEKFADCTWGGFLEACSRQCLKIITEATVTPIAQADMRALGRNLQDVVRAGSEWPFKKNGGANAMPLFVTAGPVCLTLCPQQFVGYTPKTKGFVLEHVVPVTHSVPGLDNLGNPDALTDGLKRGFITTICRVARFEDQKLSLTKNGDFCFPFKRYSHQDVAGRDGIPLRVFSTLTGKSIPLNQFSWDDYLITLCQSELLKSGLSFIQCQLDNLVGREIHRLLAAYDPAKESRSGKSLRSSGKFSPQELQTLYQAVQTAITQHCPPNVGHLPLIRLGNASAAGRLKIQLFALHSTVPLLILNIGPQKNMFELYTNSNGYDAINGPLALRKVHQSAQTKVNFNPRPAGFPPNGIGYRRYGSSAITDIVKDAEVCLAAMATV